MKFYSQVSKQVLSADREIVHQISEEMASLEKEHLKLVGHAQTS